MCHFSAEREIYIYKGKGSSSLGVGNGLVCANNRMDHMTPKSPRKRLSWWR